MIPAPVLPIPPMFRALAPSLLSFPRQAQASFDSTIRRFFFCLSGVATGIMGLLLTKRLK